MSDEALAEIMSRIAKDLRQIKDDLRWFRQREEQKPRVLTDVAVEEANRLVVSRQQTE